MRHLNGGSPIASRAKTPCPTSSCCGLATTTPRARRPGGPTPKSSVADNDLAVGRAVEAVSHSPFWDRPPSSSLRTMPRTEAITWTRTAASRLWSANTPRVAPWRAFHRQSFLLHRQRRPHHGDVAQPASHEQQRRLQFADLQPLQRPRRPAPLRGRLLQPRQWPHLHRQPKNAAGAKESMKMDFRHADRARRAKAERDSVEGCDGRCRGARNAEGTHTESQQG